LRATGLSYSQLLAKSDLELRELFPQADTKDHTRYKTLLDYLPKVYADRNLAGFTIRKKKKARLPQQHICGQTMFVDYAGKKPTIIDKQTGEVIEVELFVAILPWSQYTYAEVSHSQKKACFINSMNNCLHFFGGSPIAIVSDNLKSAVTKASKYEPYVNKTFKSFGLHYNSVIHPARPYKATDKALVEGAVKLCYQRILFPLRNMTFFSIEEFNIEIRKKLAEHNRTNFQDMDYSRLDLFKKTEKAQLRALPAQKFLMRDYKWLTVNLAGHVKLNEDKHYYSVPCELNLIGKKVEMQYSQDTVELYRNSKRIATHKRKHSPGYSTRPEHLSKEHQQYSKWNIN